MNRFNWRLATPIILALAIISAVILMWYGTSREAAKPQTQQESEADRLAKERAEAERKAKEEGEAQARAFGNIYFDFDGYNIRGDQLLALSRNADKMKTRPEFKITIEGHCDERGTIEYNLALGQRRGDSARKFLVKQGIDAGRLTTVSYGKERPTDPGHDEAAWAKNRRAAFVVTEPGLSM